MADYNNYLHPYKQIIINVYPELAKRVSTKLKGPYVKGVTSNLSFHAYLSFLFEINEHLPQNHKLTDFKIARCLVNEYPTQKTSKRILAYESGKTAFAKNNSVATYRNRYNRGEIPSRSRMVRLGPISYPYNEDGFRMNYQGKVMTEDQKLRWDAKFTPETRKHLPDFDWKVVTPRPSRYKRVNKYDSFDWCI